MLNGPGEVEFVDLRVLQFFVGGGEEYESNEDSAYQPPGSV